MACSAWVVAVVRLLFINPRLFLSRLSCNLFHIFSVVNYLYFCYFNRYPSAFPQEYHLLFIWQAFFAMNFGSKIHMLSCITVLVLKSWWLPYFAFWFVCGEFTHKIIAIVFLITSNSLTLVNPLALSNY